MYCIKCGREVADGELFCDICSNKSEEKKPEAEERQPERTPEIQPVRPQKAPVKPAPKKRMNILLIPMILLVLITVAACVLVLRFYNEMNITKNTYRVKEANLISQINELESMQKQLEEKTLALQTAEAEAAELEKTVADLEETIELLEGSASQDVYDAAAAQQTISRLEGEKEDLNEEITDLEETNEELSETIEQLAENIEELNETITEMEEDVQLAQADLEAKEEEIEDLNEEIETLNEEIEALTEDLRKAEEKASFMDTYVVFVNNDDTDLYHKYDCSRFTKADFWAYSRKLAENYGYTACPSCGG